MNTINVIWLLLGILLGLLLNLLPQRQAILILLDENGRMVGPATPIPDSSWTEWRNGHKRLRRDVLIHWTSDRCTLASGVLFTHWGRGAIDFPVPIEVEPGMKVQLHDLVVSQGRAVA